MLEAFLHIKTEQVQSRFCKNVVGTLNLLGSPQGRFLILP
jgi:hypothetical protein